MEVKVNINNIEVIKELKKISRKQRSAIDTALKKVSNMALLMITRRTQAG